MRVSYESLWTAGLSSRSDPVDVSIADQAVRGLARIFKTGLVFQLLIYFYFRGRLTSAFVTPKPKRGGGEKKIKAFSFLLMRFGYIVLGG